MELRVNCPCCDKLNCVNLRNARRLLCDANFRIMHSLLFFDKHFPTEFAAFCSALNWLIIICHSKREVSSEDIPERQQETYKVALELELWKEMEQEKFIKGM